jgi:hypothetical protein
MTIVRTVVVGPPAIAALALFISTIAVLSAIICGA